MKRILIPIFYTLLVRPWLKYLIGVRFENVKALKDADQFIIIANHNSHFDTVSIMASLPPKHFLNTHPVAAGDYFSKTKVLDWVSKNILNTIHINRKREPGTNQPSTIDVLNGLLKQDHLPQEKSVIILKNGKIKEVN